jgi:hypothetical protein
MVEFLKEIIGNLVGGALAVATGFWLFWIQRRSNAKDDFHATIDTLRAKLSISRKTTDVFYNESVELLRLAIFKVRRFLRPNAWTRLLQTFQDYENEKRWFESPERVLCLMVDLESKGHPHPQAFLDDFLDRFDDCVS